MAKRPARKSSPSSKGRSPTATARKPAAGGRKAAAARRAKPNRPPKAAAKPAGRVKGAKPVRKAKGSSSARKPSVSGRKAKPAASRQVRTRAAKTASKRPSRLPRALRSNDDPTIPSPPSSLNLNRRATAARTGRAEIAEHQAEHASLTPDIAAGDVDVNVEDAYFSGDEAPGGDNQTPDQDIVDNIGKALGVEYQDDEELQSGEKLVERDRKRWELDPASAEDYRDRVQDGGGKRRRGKI